MHKIRLFCRESEASVLHKTTSIAGEVLHFSGRGKKRTWRFHYHHLLVARMLRRERKFNLACS